MAKYYIWQFDNGGYKYYIATDTLEITENTPFEQVDEYNGTWSGSFEHIGDNENYLTGISISESDVQQLGQVDYNKHPFDGDLIVEWNENLLYGMEITYANPDYFGEIDYDQTYTSDSGKGYICDGPISEEQSKQSLKVRLIGRSSEPEDFVIELNSNYGGDGFQWNNVSDSFEKTPIYVQYSMYSGGSPYALRVVERTAE